MDIQDFTADATENFRDGEVIIKEGDTCSDKMYIINCGEVGVYKNYGELGQEQVASLRSGAFFGEMSLFLGEGRTATVVADGDVSAFVLNRDNALDFFKLQPRATFALIQDLCGRIVNTNTKMGDNRKKYDRTVIDLNIEKEVLRTTANTDALTGVFNRRYFMETANTMREDAVTCKKEAYVTLIDLDFFKKVNDTYGHQAGDETLKTASKVVSNTVRSNDFSPATAARNLSCSLWAYPKKIRHSLSSVSAQISRKLT